MAVTRSPGLALLRLAQGRPTAAGAMIRRALDEAQDPISQARLLIAEACAAVGDHDTASMEAGAARVELDSLATAEILSANVEPGTSEGLTKRELEILRLLARGVSNRAIAHELIIREKTVASHVSHIFTKLAVTSQSAATAYAYDHDLVE